jgi:hypothetical protein
MPVVHDATVLPSPSACSKNGGVCLRILKLTDSLKPTPLKRKVGRAEGRSRQLVFALAVTSQVVLLLLPGVPSASLLQLVPTSVRPCSWRRRPAAGIRIARGVGQKGDRRRYLHVPSEMLQDSGGMNRRDGSASRRRELRAAPKREQSLPASSKRSCRHSSCQRALEEQGIHAAMPSVSRAALYGVV